MDRNPTINACLSAGLFAAVIWLMLTAPAVGEAQDSVRIVIDTRALTLKVIEGNQEKLSFINIAIGRYGADSDRRRGDNTTPLGRFTIGWITDDTSFHRFFGFNYPSKEYAQRAFQAGRLDRKTLDRIRQDIASGRVPPQDTVLGGYLGIHGTGRGDSKVHDEYNWTNGCVALTNEQIDVLTDWITIGTVVEIH